MYSQIGLYINHVRLIMVLFYMLCLFLHCLSLQITFRVPTAFWVDVLKWYLVSGILVLLICSHCFGMLKKYCLSTTIFLYILLTFWICLKSFYVLKNSLLFVFWTFSDTTFLSKKILNMYFRCLLDMSIHNKKIWTELKTSVFSVFYWRIKYRNFKFLCL